MKTECVYLWHTEEGTEEGTEDGTESGITGAGDSMVMVKVSETYDLSTKVNKMGIVGIHTPIGTLINRMWGGLLLHYKKFQFVKCDVAMACASMLPADPLQVGVEAGTIAPQDLFNPILYRAVSNDSMSNILAYLQSFDGEGDASLSKGSVTDINNANFNDGADPANSLDQFQMYYGLLADSDGWRKAMPQSGLTMNGLYPLVYQVVNSYGANFPRQFLDGTKAQKYRLEDINVPTIPAPDAEFNVSTMDILSTTFRGPPMRMPPIDTTAFTGMQVDANAGNGLNLVNPLETGLYTDKLSTQLGDNTPAVPPAYVAMIVLPPAKLNQLYYRLKVTWTIELTGLRSLSDVTNWANLANIGNVSYGSDYTVQSQALSAKTSMVDAEGADVNKVMESS